MSNDLDSADDELEVETSDKEDPVLLVEAKELPEEFDEVRSSRPSRGGGGVVSASAEPCENWIQSARMTFESPQLPRGAGLARVNRVRHRSPCRILVFGKGLTH